MDAPSTKVIPGSPWYPGILSIQGCRCMDVYPVLRMIPGSPWYPGILSIQGCRCMDGPSTKDDPGKSLVSRDT